MCRQFFREASQTQEKLEKNQTKKVWTFKTKWVSEIFKKTQPKTKENSTTRRRRKQARTQKQPMNQIRNQATKEKKKTQRTKNNEISEYE